jgi:hypothetical protein
MFYGDFGHDHSLELYFDNGDYLLLYCVEKGFLFLENDSFGLSADFDDFNKKHTFYIHDYEIFKKMLKDSDDVNNLKIPYDITDVTYTEEDGYELIRKQ